MKSLINQQDPSRRISREAPKVVKAKAKVSKKKGALPTLPELLNLEPDTWYSCEQIKGRCEELRLTIWDMGYTLIEVLRAAKIPYNTFYGVWKTGRLGPVSGPAFQTIKEPFFRTDL